MGNVAFVCGSGGIGSAVITKLSADGFTVCASFLHHEPDRCEGVTYCRMDLALKESVEQAIQQVLREHHTIDVVVHAASAPLKNQPILAKAWPDYATHLDVQVRGLVNIFECLKPQIKSKHRTRFIVILTEGCIGTPPKSLADYITAKYALMGLAKTMAVELAPYNCTVNMVSPGLLQTKLTAHYPAKLVEMATESTPLKRLATPADVAELVAFLASGRADSVNGANIVVNGGSVLL